MADAVIDEVAIDIVPELKNFLNDMRRQAIPAADRVGQEIGNAIGHQIPAGIITGVVEGLRKAKARTAGASIDVKADLDTKDAEARLAKLRTGGGSVSVDVDLDLAAAKARLLAFRRSGGSINVGGGAGGGGGAAGGVTAVGSAAENSRFALAALVAVGVGLGPAIVPAAAVAAGAIVAIGAAASVAAAAVATIGLGFAGIGDAYQALSDQSKKANAAASGQVNQASQIQSALERIGSAERALTNAQADAADQAIRNAEAQVSADRRVLAAQEALTRAQQALTDARREAVRTLEDLALASKEAATADEEAALTLRRAQANLEKVTLDESKTDDERLDARLQVEKATEAIDRQGLATKRLAEEKAAADKKGVEGSDQVVAAQRDVRDAQQDVSDALQDQQDTARQVAADQRRTASALIEAQLNVTQAQRAYTDALQQTGSTGVSALNKVNEAMSQLSPAGREFVKFLFTEMKPALDQLKSTAQENLLPGVEQALKNLKPLLPQINQLIAVFGQALGQIAIKIVAALNGPSFQKFLNYLITEGPKILGYLVTIGLSLFDIFTTLIVAFGPSTDQILGGLASFTAGLAAFLEQFVQSDDFKQFMQYLLDNGPLIASLLLEIAIVTLKLLIAFAPLGGIILEGLVQFFGFLAGLDPNVLLLIFVLLAAAIGVVLILFTGPVGIIVGIIALGIAIAGLFALVVNFIPKIGHFFAGLWDDYLKPAGRAIGNFFTETIPGWLSDAWHAVSNYFDRVGNYISDLPGRLARLGTGMWSWLGTSIKNALNDALYQWNRFAARFGFTLPDILGGGRLALPQLSYFAAGGVVPGYTPGRDTTLVGVSGGEAIMRPEWTRAIGPQYVAAANAAARTGGITGVRSFLGAMGNPRFATGGIYQPSGLSIAAASDRTVGNSVPTGQAAQPLVGAINLYGSKASTRQDAQLVADELGWRARIGTGR